MSRSSDHRVCLSWMDKRLSVLRKSRRRKTQQQEEEQPLLTLYIEYIGERK
jgi:hypothetical protein